MYLVAIYITKLISFFSKLFKIGAGFTWPGHVALRIYPDLLKDTRLYPKKGVIFISATNGKTTTAKLISHVLTRAGYNVVSNESGANLLNGIVTALTLKTSPLGFATSDFGVIEVDEFALPGLLKNKNPDMLILLNLSRDQLDRYGETDTILERWEASLTTVSGATKLLIDSTQKKLENLSKIFKGTTYYFDDFQGSIEKTTLVGNHNAKNLNAALIAASFFGITKDVSIDYLKDFKSAWGRGEVLHKNNVTWRVILAKNPLSFNTNLQMLVKNNFDAKKVLIMLNDNIPDGRDVSWIYDIDPNLLKSVCVDKTIYVAGSRAFDMAARLQYAGVTVDSKNVFINTRMCLEDISEHAPHESVIALPNYSAMLELRKLLTGKKIL